MLAVEVERGNAIADGFLSLWRSAFNGALYGVEKCDGFFGYNGFLHMRIV